MKRTLTIFVVLFTMLGMPRMMAAEFAYDAGAELVSAYLWRGTYNGGISLQPNVAIGFDAEHSSLRVGAWGSVGASDWAFRSGLTETSDSNPNTYFIPEVDLFVTFDIWGIQLGATHYYYFGGSPFLNWGSIDAADGSEGTSQTEVTIGYDFRTLFEVPLTLTWNTIVAGDDAIENKNGDLVRAFSTYIEAMYEQPLPLDMTLSLALGISPWKSALYNTAEWDASADAFRIANFALNNISLRLDKEWDLGVCSLTLFGQAMLNTCGISKGNLFNWEAGDDKLYMQKMNGCIGVGAWF